MRKISLLLFLAVTCFITVIQAQETFPVNDVDNPKEGCYAFINATIFKDGTAPLQNASMVIRKGKIEAVGY